METLKVSVELSASCKRLSRHRIFVLLYFRLFQLHLLHQPSKVMHFYTKNKKIITRFPDSCNSNNSPIILSS